MQRNLCVVRLGAPLLAFMLTACAGSVVPRAPQPATRDALLVLPGFGYSNAAERQFRQAQAALAAENIDLFAPDYVEREGLDESREELREFIAEQNLGQYRRIHVFAFIAGAWTLNPLLDSAPLPNVATVIYDRSPMQERAPRVADDKLHFLTWLFYGRPVFDMARSPYPQLMSPGPRVGILVETKPTKFLRRFRKKALSYGPIRFECDALGQRRDDCIYVDLNHDELYLRFMDVLPEVLAFIRTGRFTDAAIRTPPDKVPLP
jgi:hypothetical protein